MASDDLLDILNIACYQMNRRLSLCLAEFGLTIEQWRILEVVSREPMNIRELSNATLVPHSTIRRWLAQTEEAGLISQRVLPGDRRSVEVSITAKGRLLFARVSPIIKHEHTSSTYGLSRTEYSTLVELLSRLCDSE